VCHQPAAGSATVTVAPDGTAPVVAAPAPVTVTQSLCCGITFAGASGATNAAVQTFLSAGSATEECTTATRLAPQVGGGDADSATCFSTGTTNVTFRFQDVAGNVGTALSSVTVRTFGDLDVDGTIGASDLVILRGYLNLALSPGTPPFLAPSALADLNHDATVDATDMVLLRSYLGLAVACLAP
jgi:hypothetical protein